MRAHHGRTDEELFSAQWVRVRLGPDESAGCKSDGRACDESGEGFNLKLEVMRTGRVLCQACAGERYYTRL
jgi:formylmethanofuran dehydrogenase subunit E